MATVDYRCMQGGSTQAHGPTMHGCMGTFPTVVFCKEYPLVDGLAGSDESAVDVAALGTMITLLTHGCDIGQITRVLPVAALRSAATLGR